MIQVVLERLETPDLGLLGNQLLLGSPETQLRLALERPGLPENP
jgi:hypothetical protein